MSYEKKIIFLCIILFSLTLAFVGAKIDEFSDKNCTIYSLRGKVFLKTNINFEWRLATLDDGLFIGDGLSTHENSKVELITKDTSYIYMPELTDIIVKEIYFNSLTGGSNIVIELTRGMLFANVKNYLNYKSRFEIHTLNAVVILKDKTKLMVKYNDTENATVVAVFSGKVEIWQIDEKNMLKNKTILTNKQECAISTEISPVSKIRERLVDTYKHLFKNPNKILKQKEKEKKEERKKLEDQQDKKKKKKFLFF